MATEIHNQVGGTEQPLTTLAEAIDDSGKAALDQAAHLAVPEAKKAINAARTGWRRWISQRPVQVLSGAFLVGLLAMVVKNRSRNCA